MKRTEILASRIRTPALALLGIFLALTSLRVQALELGVINSWLNNDTGGGYDYGFKVTVRQDLCRYFDIGARIGYMRSDSLGADYLPLVATAAIKYPLFEDRFVPFIGTQFGYHFYDKIYRNSQELTPTVGFDWRLGERKQWSFFFEGVYQFGHVHLKSDDSSRPVDGPGVSWGFSFRF